MVPYPTWRGNTINSRGFLIWPEGPVFGFNAQHWVERVPDASGSWIVRLGCRGEERGRCNDGVPSFSLGSATVDIMFRSAAYVREATPMRALRDPRTRGLLLPRICGQGTRPLVHTTQCVLARAWAEILEVVAQVCVCVCVALHSARLLGPPFAEVGICKSRPRGNPEGPRHYPLAR